MLTFGTTAATTDRKSESEIVHSMVGDSSSGVAGSLKMHNIGRRQSFSSAMTDSYDPDIQSPKSVTFSPDGKRFYINSLEGCKTVVYDAATLRKLHTIDYDFTSGTGTLWGTPSGYYPFTHYPNGETRPFKGKPVESTWSHHGRYLWIPFYRRTFDINAQDPSAIAVIDTRDHSIIRMFETGPLPKMTATSPDGKLIAVTHWGDNTVGLIDISSPDPAKWHHLPPITVGHKLNLNYSLTTPVNRDSNSGMLLRGTVFTPDNRYLLVSAMAGNMAVIDVNARRYLGTVPQLPAIRHLIIHDGWVYGSMNTAGMAISFTLDDLYQAIDRARTDSTTTIRLTGEIKKTHVAPGARTLEISPDGKYLFVACNTGNAVYAVDAATMTVADHIRNDSYPVGLAISPDGLMMVVTSQGRKDQGGGNAINIYRIDRPDMPAIRITEPDTADTATCDTLPTRQTSDSKQSHITRQSIIISIAIIAFILLIASVMVYKRKSGKKN